MKKKELTATTLRIILSISLVLVVAICAAAFVFANNKLKVVAVDTSHAVIDAQASQNNLSSLQAMQRELAKQHDTIARTNSIVADSQSYQYQNQIIADLNDYARRAHISITNLDFGSTASTAPAAAAAPGTAPAPAAAGTPAGVKSTSVSVTLVNPVAYTDLLSFVNLIEQNLTKMQISKISLSADATPGKVTSDALTIEVYIR